MTAELTILKNINGTGEAVAFGAFESDYLALRKAEQRVYSDAEVRLLPQISSTHPHYREWIIRKRSADKLKTWLAAKKKPLKVLEVGCGNGWLSHQLALIPECSVTGCDVNYTELQQAAAVFADTPSLYFIYGDLRNDIFREKSFDCIVFAASIQYFSSFEEIVAAAKKLLHTGGEIHILDSHFYSKNKLAAARQRTDTYYSSLGFPEMKARYFHHDMSSLQQFDHTLLYNPASFKNFFSKNKNPFPWICIR